MERDFLFFNINSKGCSSASGRRPTFHSDREGVRDGAVAVGGSALVLAVVLLGDAAEVKPAVITLQLATRLIQATVLLLPFHLWSGSADTETRIKKKNRGTEERKEVTDKLITAGKGDGGPLID